MIARGPFDARPVWRRRVSPGTGLLIAVLLSCLGWLPVIAGLHVLWRWMS